MYNLKENIVLRYTCIEKINNKKERITILQHKTNYRIPRAAHALRHNEPRKPRVHICSLGIHLNQQLLIDHLEYMEEWLFGDDTE